MKSIKKLVLVIITLSMLTGFTYRPSAQNVDSTLEKTSIQMNDDYTENKYNMEYSNGITEYIVERLYSNGDHVITVYSEDNVELSRVSNIDGVLKVIENGIEVKDVPVIEEKEETVWTYNLDVVNPRNSGWIYSTWRTSYYTNEIGVKSASLLASLAAGALGVLYGLAYDLISGLIGIGVKYAPLKKVVRTKIKKGGTTIIEEGTLYSYKNNNYTNLHRSRSIYTVLNP